MTDRFDDLKRLAEMRDSGHLTEAEYQRLKTELLAEGEDTAVTPPPAVLAPDDAEGIENQTRWWLIGTGVLMAVGSLLPWAQAGIFSAAGTEGDGIFTLIGGVVVALVGIANRSSLVTGIATAAVAGFSLWITYSVFERLYDPIENVVGTGIYLTGFASLFALIAGFKLIGQARKRSEA